MSEPAPLYELRIVASGEVRDADGNLVQGDIPVESIINVTEAQARELLGQVEQ